MTWSYFIYFAIVAVLLWTFGALSAWKEKVRGAYLFTAGGLLVFFSFIIGMWITLEHPPLRTMGETRLWYSAFLPLVGLIVYARWNYKWILSFSTVLSTVFICVNIFRPEIHSKTLMPALQSPWFAPHVIVYMFAYALLGAATLMAVYSLAKRPKSHTASSSGTAHRSLMSSIDDLVRVGLAFLTFGMLFGALWAKEAWGHYWSWDPKETWAAITWFGYLVYIHYRQMPTHRRRIALWMLILCFVLLQVCWWGINYLPAAQGMSVHTYG
ncbi:MAG: cytochrome c biogenesis protein CcsA [Bacteroidaceae bacterium]|nr:cytochrome c biogenesis protein CcsA [Bacteroidaceae bacterium]